MNKKKKHLAHINEFYEEQTLKTHLEKTAKYAGATMKKVNLYYLGYMAGLIHDMGKATEVFNDYLRRSHNGEKVVRGSVNHTFAAVIFLWERYHKSQDVLQDLTAEMLAYAAGAHHGLFDCITMDGKSEFVRRLQKDRAELCYAEAVETFLEEVISGKALDNLFAEAVKEIKKFIEKTPDYYACSMLLRLLTAALIDADRLDTEEFMEKRQLVNEDVTAVFWERNLEFCEKRIAKLSGKGKVQEARKYISQACLRKAGEGAGIYLLNVPTGGGKTLAALRYALAHAAKKGKSRIIFLIPLLSVLEQNSKVIRDHLYNTEAVVEHHSNVLKIKETEEELNTYEFVVNTWDSPIVISTLVQFLNVLFDGKTTSVRRMKSLCNSVIVIDEIQSLPWKTTAMFIQTMNFLVDYCDATIVLSSATQPCFDKLKPALKLALKPQMVEPDFELFSAFERTRVIDKTRPEGYSTLEVADFADELLQQTSSVMMIGNTKKTVREIFYYARERKYTVYHLSTSMCMAHRARVIKRIREALEWNQKNKKKRKILCVTTQLVEAGVDISFETVIRASAGMDNVVQSAGRCNRSFDYGEICNVYIMNVRNENLTFLKEIQNRQEATNRLLNAFRSYPKRYDGDLTSPKSIETYYECLYQNLQDKGTLKYVVQTKRGRNTLYEFLAEGIEGKADKKQILRHPFQTAGNLFQVFDVENMDVLVPYDEAAKKLIGELGSKRAAQDYGYAKELLKSISPYSVHMFEYEIQMLENRISHYEIGGRSFYVLKEGNYDDETGVCMENKMEILIQ